MRRLKKSATIAAQACIAVCVMLAPHARAQSWKPDKPVEIVVTCQPGCGPDIAARIIQKIWQDHRLVQVPSAVINKAGGGGAVAYSYIQQKPGDGHVMVLSGAGAVVNSIMGRGVGYKDITPLAMINGEYVGVAVRPDSAFRSGRELIDALKKDFNAVSFGISNSLGNANHQAIALAMKVSGIPPAKARTVVFQSGAHSITALLGSHVQAAPASVGLWVNPLKAGQVRVIAVSAPKRLTGELAHVATWREQGIDAVISVWRMMTAPPGLSPAQLAYWHDALRRTIETPEWKRELELHYQSDEFMVGSELANTLDALHAQLKALLTDLQLAK